MSISVKLQAEQVGVYSPSSGERRDNVVSSNYQNRDVQTRISYYQKVSHYEKVFSLWTLLPLVGFFSVISGKDPWHNNERRILGEYLSKASSAPVGENVFYKIQYVAQLLDIAEDLMGRAVILRGRGDKKAARHFSNIALMVSRGGNEVVSGYGEIEDARVNANSGSEKLSYWSIRMLDVKVRWQIFLSNVTGEKFFYEAAKGSMLHLFEKLAESTNPADKELLRFYAYFARLYFGGESFNKFAEMCAVPENLSKNMGMFLFSPIPEILPYESKTFRPLAADFEVNAKLIRDALLRDSVKFYREMSHLRRGLHEVLRSTLTRIEKK